jgi:hypothetical protein
MAVSSLSATHFCLLAVLVAAFLIIFPGRQTPIAFSLATGIGISGLQNRVDQLEAKAIAGLPPTEDDKAFLGNLYACFGKGGQLTIVLRQAGQFMRHYLSKSGGNLRTAPRIFVNSRPVQEVMQSLKQRIMVNYAERGSIDEMYSSQTFYMGDPEFLDAHVGLYFGRVVARPHVTKEGTVTLLWRAEVPWNWPSYKSVHDQYGDYHAQCFPIPNSRSWLQGPQYCLRMDDGLGGYLAEIGLAEPFLVYSEWEEEIKAPARSVQ